MILWSANKEVEEEEVRGDIYSQGKEDRKPTELTFRKGFRKNTFLLYAHKDHHRVRTNDRKSMEKMEKMERMERMTHSYALLRRVWRQSNRQIRGLCDRFRHQKRVVDIDCYRSFVLLFFKNR